MTFNLLSEYAWLSLGGVLTWFDWDIINIKDEYGVQNQQKQTNHWSYFTFSKAD